MGTPNTRKIELALAYLSLGLLATALLGTPLLAAQAPAASPATAPVPKTVHRHTRPSAAHLQTPPAEATPAPATPPVPEAPHWPANDKPSQASITWDSQGLRIDASNSSLQQILRDVSTATGAKVEGLNSDQRIFGSYGPGQARDVLSQLLQGSGYNVIMIGDQGQGAPRQIVLSARHNTGETQTAANDNQPNGSDNEEDPDEQPPQFPVRPGFGPGGPPRTPQQIMQEMQQRQQQMRQQQNNPQ